MGIAEENGLGLESLDMRIELKFALGTKVPLTFFAVSRRIGASRAKLGDHFYIKILWSV